MKSIIFAFVLIAVVSCDVIHLDKGDGWHKDETGYHYDTPEAKLDVPEEVAIEEISDEPEPILEDEVIEVVDEYLPPVDYLPPNNDLKEYLPPKTEDAKRKRQIPVRKVYRRFVKKH